MRTRVFIISGYVIGTVVAFSVMLLFAQHMADRSEDRWRETCRQLDAELVDAPKFYGCVRDGEVVYPQNG